MELDIVIRQVADADLEMELDIVIRQDVRDLRAALAVQAREHREAARRIYHEMVCIIAAMGQDGRKFRREGTQRLRAVVAEVYSVPRVTAAAKRHPRLGIVPGLALDLTGVDEKGVPWDFNDPRQRKKEEALIDFQEPAFIFLFERAFFL